MQIFKRCQKKASDNDKCRHQTERRLGHLANSLETKQWLGQDLSKLSWNSRYVIGLIELARQAVDINRSATDTFIPTDSPNHMLQST